jgi:hypothetical protein
MASGPYLYQKIMDVPGLSGSAGERQSQLYQRLGSPMGAYTGSLDQNLWLLNQINSGNIGQPTAPTTPTPAYTIPTPTAVTPFESVLPYNQVFNQNLIQGLAESQIMPEIQRQQGSALQSYNRNIGGSGGYKSGVGIQGRENIMNDYSRQGREQVGQFTSDINNYGTDWYNQLKTSYNQQPGMFVQQPLPDFNTFLQQNPNLGNLYNTQTNIPTTYQNYLNF